MGMNQIITLGQFDALVGWNEKKTVRNFVNMYKLWFNYGSPVYRVWRIFYNTITGRYQERESFYTSRYDTMVKN